MNSYDVVIIGYAVNQKSGGYTDNSYPFLETIGGKYLYNNCFLDTYCAEPMAFQQLSAQLNVAGFNTKVIDGLILGYNKDKLIEELDKIDSNIFNFSIYESSKEDVYEVIHQLKRKRPWVKIVTGGPYPTISADEIMNENPDIDYIVVGDADYALPNLVSKVLNKQNLSNVPNLIYRNNGKIITNSTMCADLNSLEYPDRLYSDIIIDKGFSFSISSSRGCGYANCSFCYLPQYQKVGGQPKHRYKDPIIVVDEIKDLISRFNIEKLSFTDEDFFGDKNGVKRALEIFKLLIQDEIRVSLHVNARVNTILHLIKNDLLGLCVAAGVNYMYVGLESYNDSALERYDKKIRTSDIDCIVRELSKYDISINPGLITFDPELSIDEVKNNIDLFRKINYYDAFMFTRRLTFYPHAADKIRELKKDDGYFFDYKTEQLYNAMSKYLDNVFPEYLKLNKDLANDELVNELISCHFEFFYKVYSLIKIDSKIPEEIFEQFTSKVKEIIAQVIKVKNR